MSMRSFGLILLWALSCTLALGARVAVVDSTKSPDLADLLTSALAKNDGIEVLERAQMDKLVTEQQLQELTQAGKFSALGKLIGADGLVIMDNIPGGQGPPQPTVRLISVATGACVMIHDLPPTTTSDEDAAIWIAHSVGESTAALTEKIEGLVPVALVSIRSELTTKSSGDLDRALKLLLEKRLGNTPGLLLLERRRLGDVAFDKSLDASDAQPLLKGAILIEGTLTSPQADSTFTGKVRLSRKDGTLAREVDFTGTTNALPAAVEQLAAQITDAVGLSKTTNTSTNPPEGHRFYLEARLAWRADDLDSAEESLSAARVLGDGGPEASWLTLAMAEAKLNRETANLDWPFLLKSRQIRLPNPALTADWAELRTTVDDTLADLAAFRQSILTNEHESALKFDLNKDSWDTDYYLFSRHVLRYVCLFLWQRDEKGDETVEPVRQQIRLLALQDKWPDSQSPLGFNTLLGVPGAALTLPIPLLAQTSDELLSWYEKIFRWNEPSDWATYIPRDDATALGPRFNRQPAVVEAWHSLLQQLTNDPATSLRVRLFLTGTLETPEEQTNYAEVLDEIGQHAVELQNSGELPVLLTWNSVSLPLPLQYIAIPGRSGLNIRRIPAVRIARARLQLMVTLFNLLPKFEKHIFGLNMGKALIPIPDDLVQPLQEAFLAYRSRCLAEPVNHQQLTAYKTVFNNWQSLLNRGNAQFDFSSIQATEDGLAVDQFWQPDALVDYPFQLLTGNNETLWLSGREGADNVIYQLTLPALQTFHKEVVYGAYQIALTSSGTIWGVRSDAYSPNSSLWAQNLTWPGPGIKQRILEGTPQTDLTRWNTTTGEGKVWEVSRQYNVYTMNDQVFLTLAYPHTTWVTPQDALFEVNTSDGSLSLLASTERRPPENPFDGISFQTIAVGQGPGGTPVIAYNTDTNTSKIRQLGNDWSLLLQNKFAFVGSIQASKQTMLIGKGGNLVLLDPELDKPQMFVWHQPGGTVEMANGWAWPKDWSGTQFAYRTGELFSLAEDDLRWWYNGGPAEGVLIHLKLASHVKPPSAALPPSIPRSAPPSVLGQLGSTFDANAPAPASIAEAKFERFDPPLIGNNSVLNGIPKGYDIIATPSGLIVTDKVTGLWFIPNKDLDAHREPTNVDATDDAVTDTDL